LWNGDFIDSFSTARNAIASPLLRLPAEIRHEIFSYVALDGTYKIEDFGDSTGTSFYLCGLHPSWTGLLRTCRQTNAEANTLPYVLNTFRMNLPYTWDPLVAQLAKLRNPIASLRLEIDWFRTWQGEGGPLKPLPHLQKVEVHVMTEIAVSIFLASFSGEEREQNANHLNHHYWKPRPGSANGFSLQSWATCK
jgi:hypothetical protein